MGLAFKVLHALHVRRRGAPRDRLPEELRELLDLVAVGTIADLAAAAGENRYYVNEGLKLIAIGQRVGLRALAGVSGCTGSTDSGTVAYRLAPRLNAAGRLADPSPPLRLLLTDDEKEARLAGAEAPRAERRAPGRGETDPRAGGGSASRAGGTLPPVLVLRGQGLARRGGGHRGGPAGGALPPPAILLGIRDGVAKGSGRSIARYDIMEGLNACADHLTIYGGHPQAVGLTLEADRVDDFRAAIEEHAASGAQPRATWCPPSGATPCCGATTSTPTRRWPWPRSGPSAAAIRGRGCCWSTPSLQQAETTRDGSHLRCTVEVDGVKRAASASAWADRRRRCRPTAAGRLVGAQFRVDEWQGALRPEFLIEHVGARRPKRRRALLRVRAFVPVVGRRLER